MCALTKYKMLQREASAWKSDLNYLPFPHFTGQYDKHSTHYRVDQGLSYFSATGFRIVIRLAAFLLLLMGAAGAAALKTWHKFNISFTDFYFRNWLRRKTCRVTRIVSLKLLDHGGKPWKLRQRSSGWQSRLSGVQLPPPAKSSSHSRGK